MKNRLPNSNSIRIEWKEFNLELYEEHKDVLNILLEKYDNKDNTFDKYDKLQRILTRQKGGEYHGWLVILGIILSTDRGLEDMSNFEVEANINNIHPDLYAEEYHTIVEAGSPGTRDLEHRAEGIIRCMLSDERFPTDYLTKWKFVNIPKSVFVQKEFEKNRRFEFSDSPNCNIIKPSNIELDLGRSNWGYWMPGWANIARDERPKKYDPDYPVPRENL